MESTSANLPPLAERQSPGEAREVDRWPVYATAIALTISSLELWAAMWWAASSLISRL
jgi:hypothetical protein